MRILSSKVECSEIIIVIYGNGSVSKCAYSKKEFSLEQRYILGLPMYQMDIKILEDVYLFLLSSFNSLFIIDLRNMSISFKINFSYQDIQRCKSLSISNDCGEITLIADEYCKQFWIPPLWPEATLLTLCKRIICANHSETDIMSLHIPKSLKSLLTT